MTLTDARGVEIAPGDTAIYGFGVSRSVAMAEAVVLGAHESVNTNPKRVGSGKFTMYDTDCSCGHKGGPCPDADSSVSLTPSGRVRLRVVRRSYSSGEKATVDVAPDRLVVLKEVDGPFQPGTPEPCFALPPSPLPTQAEANRQKIENLIEAYTADLRATEVPDRHYYKDWSLAAFHTYAAQQLARLSKELKELES